MLVLEVPGAITKRHRRHGSRHGKTDSTDARAIAEAVDILDAALRRERPGPYQVQAAIAACHATAETAAATDWREITALYRELAAMTGSAVVELNRAVAIGMAFGPQRGLDLVGALLDAPALKTYYLLPSVQADLLFKLGRTSEARAAFERAAALAQNVRDKKFLLERAAACRS